LPTAAETDTRSPKALAAERPAYAVSPIAPSAPRYHCAGEALHVEDAEGADHGSECGQLDVDDVEALGSHWTLGIGTDRAWLLFRPRHELNSIQG
jgi:hypothetical protein